MTAPFLRTTRARAGPALSEDTVAQNPGGSVIDASHPPDADTTADFFREHAVGRPMAADKNRRSVRAGARVRGERSIWRHKACTNRASFTPGRLLNERSASHAARRSPIPPPHRHRSDLPVDR